MNISEYCIRVPSLPRSLRYVDKRQGTEHYCSGIAQKSSIDGVNSLKLMVIAGLKNV